MGFELPSDSISDSQVNAFRSAPSKRSRCTEPEQLFSKTVPTSVPPKADLHAKEISQQHSSSTRKEIINAIQNRTLDVAKRILDSNSDLGREDLFAILQAASQVKSDELVAMTSEKLAAGSTKGSRDIFLELVGIGKRTKEVPLTEGAQEALKQELLQKVPTANLERRNASVYFTLLPYAQLMCAAEKAGMPELHAYKLAVVFTDKNKALDYLDKYYLNHNRPERFLHDACNFALPEGEHDVKTWQLLCQRFLGEDTFRELILPEACAIEKLIQTDSANKARPKAEKVKEATKEVQDIYALFSKLMRKHGTLANPANSKIVSEMKEMLQKNGRIKEGASIEECYQELGRLLHEKQMSLSQFGVAFNDQLTMPLLLAFREKHAVCNSLPYKYFLEHGLTSKNFEVFLKLVRRDDDKQIPNIRIDGSSLGYPGCYLMKVPVMDDLQAARACCFGKLTKCCQSLSGEEGEPCVIHGLTSPHGGFYVVCKGDVANPQVSDELIGQCWSWRSKDNAIVFDSIETSQKDDNTRHMTTTFFRSLASALVKNDHTHKVACGATSGISGEVGACLNSQNEEFIDYTGYSDSKRQLLLFDKESPFYTFFGVEVESTALTIKMIEAALAKNPGGGQPLFKTIEWAIEEGRLDYLAKVREIAKQSLSEQDSARLSEAIDKRILSNGYEKYHAHLSKYNKSKDSLSQLEFAVENKMYPFILALIATTSPQDLQFISGDIPTLSFAIGLIPKNPKFKQVARALIEKNVELNTQGKDTALHAAIVTKQFDLALLLIEKGALSDTNSGNETPWQTLVQQAKSVQPGIETKEYISLLRALINKGHSIYDPGRDGQMIFGKVSEASNPDLLQALTVLRDESKIDVFSQIDPTDPSDREILFDLLDKGLDPNLVDSEGNNLLFLQITSHFFSPALLVNLLEKGVKINTANHNGITPLAAAVTNFFPKKQEENIKFVEKLLEHGADVDVQDNNGDSILMKAVKKNRPQIVRLLLARGAKYASHEKEAIDAFIQKNRLI